MTDGRFTTTPKTAVRRYYQLVRRYSANLAFLADFSMLAMGEKLKRKEMMSARLGDLLSHLYLISAVLKRFHDEGEYISDRPLIDWCCQQMLYECELAIREIIANFPGRFARFILKLFLQPFGSQRPRPSDKLTRQVAKMLTQPNELRERLTRFAFKEPLPNCPLGLLEEAFHKLCAVEELEKKVSRALKEGRLHSLTLLEQIEEAEQAGVLSRKEAEQLKEAEQGRQAVIAVDDFLDEELRRQVVTFESLDRQEALAVKEV